MGSSEFKYTEKTDTQFTGGAGEKNYVKKISQNISFNDNSMNNCLVCFENQQDAVFMDCGHGGLCYTCSLDIFKKTGECYLCRKAIKQVLFLDLSSKDGNIIKVKESTRIVTSSSEN